MSYSLSAVSAEYLMVILGLIAFSVAAPAIVAFMDSATWSERVAAPALQVRWYSMPIVYAEGGYTVIGRAVVVMIGNPTNVPVKVSLVGVATTTTIDLLDGAEVYPPDTEVLTNGPSGFRAVEVPPRTVVRVIRPKTYIWEVHYCTVVGCKEAIKSVPSSLLGAWGVRPNDRETEVWIISNGALAELISTISGVAEIEGKGNRPISAISDAKDKAPYSTTNRTIGAILLFNDPYAGQSPDIPYSGEQTKYGDVPCPPKIPWFYGDDYLGEGNPDTPFNITVNITYYAKAGGGLYPIRGAFAGSPPVYLYIALAASRNFRVWAEVYVKKQYSNTLIKWKTTPVVTGGRVWTNSRILDVWRLGDDVAYVTILVHIEAPHGHGYDGYVVFHTSLLPGS